MIPCTESFSKLRVKDDTRAPYMNHYLFDTNFDIEFPIMVSPYKFTNNDEETGIQSIPEKLIDWVFKYRHNENTTKDEIKESYNKFCLEVDKIRNRAESNAKIES